MVVLSAALLAYSECWCGLDYLNSWSLAVELSIRMEGHGILVVGLTSVLFVRAIACVDGGISSLPREIEPLWRWVVASSVISGSQCLHHCARQAFWALEIEISMLFRAQIVRIVDEHSHGGGQSSSSLS